MSGLNPMAKRPPVRYVGGKWRLAEWIISFFPHHVHYCEPFCGGASILFRKTPSEIETINDRDGRIINFFRVLREQPDELIRRIELTPYAREELMMANEYGDEAEDPIEAARLFYVRATMAYGGFQMHGTGWRYITNSHGRSSRLVREWRDLRGLEFAINRLRQVQIECDDALEVVRRFDTKATLFYVDPPYVHDTRAEARLRYRYEMDDDAHRELAALLRSVRGMVVLSGYRSALYDELYQGWVRMDCSTPTNGNSMATESVWLSPSVHSMGALPLFGGQP